jgi:hypothetical protein
MIGVATITMITLEIVLFISVNLYKASLFRDQEFVLLVPELGVVQTVELKMIATVIKIQEDRLC